MPGFSPMGSTPLASIDTLVQAAVAFGGTGTLAAVSDVSSPNIIEVAVTFTGSGTLAAVSSVVQDIDDGHANVSGGGGAGAYVRQDELERRIPKKKEPRRPRTHVMKIGDWPDEATALPAVAHADGADYNEVLSGLNIEDADTDDEEAMTLIMGLAA